MGAMNRFMNFLGLQEEEEILEHEGADRNEQDQESRITESRKNKHGNNVVGLHSQRNSKIVLCEPRSYEETQEIADQLRSRRAVLVNLQRVRQDQAVRIVDFLSGTVYALSGGIAKVGANIFLCTPDSVEIHGAITEMLEVEGDYNRTR